MMNNYEAERAMNHKRIRMDGEGGPGVVQGNGLPLNYMDNGHQIPPYQPYASAYNAHYPPDFSAYGGPPPAGYAPQNLSYAPVPPAHQNYPPPHHQPFAAQQPSLHSMTHNMAPSYDQGHHKVGSPWPPQSSQVPQPTQQQNQPSQPQQNSSQATPPPAMIPKPTAAEVKILPNPATPQPNPELKIETQDGQRPKENLEMADHEQPKIKIKTDLYQQEEAVRTETDAALGTAKPTEPMLPNPAETAPPTEDVSKPPEMSDGTKATASAVQQPLSSAAGENSSSADAASTATDEGLPQAEEDNSTPANGTARASDSGNSSDGANKLPDNFPGFTAEPSSSSEDEDKISNDVYFGTPDISTYRPKLNQPADPKSTTHPPGLEPKKRGRPKGSVNKPKPPGLPPSPTAMPKMFPNTPGSALGANIQYQTPGKPGLSPIPRPGVGRPRGSTAYQFAVRPFKKDFSGVQFRRRFSDDGLDSSHIPNEVYFGDVPVSTEVLFNYYDGNLEKEKQAAAAAAAARAAAARLHQAKLDMARKNSSNPNAITTVDSSSSDSDSDDSSDSDSTDNEDPTKRRGPGRPKGSKNRPSDEGRSPSFRPDGTPIRRGRPPVPPEMRTPGITDMKRFLGAAGIKFDYKKLVDGCTKNKERVDRMRKLLDEAGLDGEPTMDKCRALRKTPAPRAPKTPKPVKEPKEKPVKIVKEPKTPKTVAAEDDNTPRRVTRGQTSNKPRQKIVISSDEEDEDVKAFLNRLKSKAKRA